METTIKTLEAVLEEGEAKFPHIVGLYQWSTNYGAGQTPFTLFIDLIGYTSHEYGQTLFNLSNVSKVIGYLEAEYLGDALKEYSDKGESAYDFTASLLNAEAQE
jgi:hypothetical protein